MTNGHKNIVISFLENIYGPLIKLSGKLPAPLAYGLAILIAVLATYLIAALFDAGLPNNLLWFVSIIALGALTSFIFIDWQKRVQQSNSESKHKSIIKSDILGRLRSLAVEYEELRSRLAPGRNRTESMNIVARKMQEYSSEMRKYYSKLAKSDSPGERLAIVMGLQRNPEIDWIDWLGNVASTDQTFLGHQATISLLESAKRYRDQKSILLIEEQVKKIEDYIDKQKIPSNRKKIIPLIKRELKGS